MPAHAIRLALFGLVASSAALVVLVGSGGAARACKLQSMPGPSPVPAVDETTGPSPLLLTGAGTSPLLYAADDEARTPIVVVEDARFARAFGPFVFGPRVRAFTPAAPLPAGRYRWLGLDTSHGLDGTAFFVDPAAPVTPPAARPVTLRLTLDEPDDEAGGCGGADSSCDDIDFTRLDLELGAAQDGVTPLAETYLITITRGDDEHLFIGRSFTTSGGRGSLFVWDGADGMRSFRSGRTCVVLTPIGDDGVVGAPVDLGCVSPDDDDPRVVDTRGCAGGGARGDAWWVALALGWTAARAQGTRPRRRRTPGGRG